ncbi:spermidine/putrescine ABC transporter permease [Leisingera sp. ANG1]|nr:spermidine/putrescine ABC transporter permease [Leisingera sp. ANG-S3]KIC52485.1 spermidine/putrescine ABC transporter permease [Leisingera sp. ANG-S]KID07505.1 spermidine/putrescine ABC transporter permease [Leisingera sp. ANG1]
MSKTAYSALWSLPLPVWLAGFFLGPMVLLIWLSFWDVKNFLLTPDFQLENWQKILTAGYFWSAYARTAVIAASASVLATLAALPCALAISFFLSPRARMVLLGLFVVPFFTSYLVRIYSWQIYLTENGIVMKLMAAIGIETGSLLNTPLALMVGLVTLTLPLVIVIQAISLLSLDRTLIDAAYNLGCGPRRVLFATVLPAARPGIVLGALFAFIFSFGDFVTATYLGGGKFTTLSILIADTVKSGQQWPRAAVVALMMIVTLLLTALASITYAYRRS